MGGMTHKLREDGERRHFWPSSTTDSAEERATAIDSMINA
jgi:hypothetical protein